jgi:P27 family predicted phage terminase small subunit
MQRAQGGGRRPRPTVLALLEGGRTSAHPNEPTYPVRLPSPPSQLTPLAKTIWRREGKRLVSAGVLTEADTAAFSAFCASYATWLEASGALRDTGLVIADDRGAIRANPLLAVARNAQAEYLKAAMEFGLTPASRSRIGARKASPAVDPFDQVVNG